MDSTAKNLYTHNAISHIDREELPPGAQTMQGISETATVLRIDMPSSLGQPIWAADDEEDGDFSVWDPSDGRWLSAFDRRIARIVVAFVREHEGGPHGAGAEDHGISEEEFDDLEGAMLRTMPDAEVEDEV